ncbi:class I adenylate-forming enzyme family protein [Cerasicoccus maritimus]|uniref:class I adenylate-forming enzyme family protein n=1 Tax=Cerasicoccus maritimus TaxID=490089 RepID=UPI0028528FB6|nr:class I adenylate-forming enzyme family protein [Cerasicoccus maritimus]
MSNEILQRWDQLVAEAPDALAIIHDQVRWTRRELDELAHKISAKLPQADLTGLGIGLHLPNGASWLAAFLALRRAGAVLVPFDAGATTDYCLEQSSLLKCFALQSKTTTLLDDAPRKWESGVALLKLTSGSSGVPKALPFTEGELCADGDNIESTMGLRRDDINFALLPLAHSYALGNLVVPLLASGIPLAIGSAPLPRIIAEEIRASGATVFPSVPAVFEAFTKFDDIDLGQLRLCISAAAPLTPALAKKFKDHFGMLIHNFYGASECGGIAYDRSGEAGLSGLSIGQPMDNVQLSTNEQGLLQVRSAAVSANGREREPEGAQLTLDDKVSFLDDGSVVISGRADRMVKCGGKRVDLGALENIVLKSPGVEFATAFHDEQADRLWVAIQGHLLADVALSKLQTAFPSLRGRIRVKRLTKIPINPRGKIDQASLKEKLLEIL